MKLRVAFSRGYTLFVLFSGLQGAGLQFSVSRFILIIHKRPCLPRHGVPYGNTISMGPQAITTSKQANIWYLGNLIVDFYLYPLVELISNIWDVNNNWLWQLPFWSTYLDTFESFSCLLQPLTHHSSLNAPTQHSLLPKNWWRRAE